MKPKPLSASQRRALSRGLGALSCPACDRRALRLVDGYAEPRVSCSKCHLVSAQPFEPHFETTPWSGGNGRTVLTGITLKKEN